MKGARETGASRRLPFPFLADRLQGGDTLFSIMPGSNIAVVVMELMIFRLWQVRYKV